MPKINTNLVDGLFNDESKKDTENTFKIVYVDIYDIVPNKRNQEISMADIRELSENIELVGLQQNLVLAPPVDDKYLLLAGHRRLSALKLLVEEKGKEEFRKIPAIINNPDDFNYILSDEKREDLLWVSSNIMTRKPTPQDLLKFTQMLNDVYTELRNNNPELVLGTKKEYIASQLNISESQVQILNSINSHLTEKALTAFLNNKLNLTVARDLAKMPERDQQEFIEQFENLSVVTAGDLIFFKKKISDRKRNIKTETVQDIEFNFEKVAELYDIVSSKLTIRELTGVNAVKAQKLSNKIAIDLEKLIKLLT